MAKGTKKKKKELTIEEKLEQALVPEEEWPYEVPENWCWVHWANVGEFVAGSGFKKEFQGFTEYEIPFYKVGSLKYTDDSGFIFDNTNTINEVIRKKIKATLIPENSVLFAKIGEAIRLNRRSINSLPCCIDNNMMAFVPKNCLMKYAYYWSIGQDFYYYTNATTVPAIRKSDLEQISFPLPPLAEQQRIVNRIESLFAKLDEAKAKAQAVVDGFEDRKAAILYKAFTGELTKSWEEQHGVNKEHWKKIKLKDCGDWIGGGTPSKSHPEYWDNGNILWITSKDMKADLIEDSQLHINMLGVENSSANYCEKNSVLFVMRSGILRRTLPIALVKTPFTVNQDLKAVSPCSDIDVDYLFWVCESNEKQILKTCMKSGTTVESINAEALFNYEIPIVPIEEQILIVKMIDNLLYREKKATEIAEKVLAHFDTIKKSILAQAFCGELGTNDSNDESAAELLKRIL